MNSAPAIDSLPTQGVGAALLNRNRFRLLGLTADQIIKYFFGGNATVAIIVLALITIFLFREGAGFFGMNLRNIRVYREAGLEYVDFIRHQVDDFTAINRTLNDVRGILSDLTDAATAIKTKETVNGDLAEQKEMLASEESLKAVPMGFREASLALGATKWQAIRTNVLPYALPGVLTSAILGIARVAGETAPIMFTAAYVMRDQQSGGGFLGSLFQGVMALPYHIYVVSSKIPQNQYTERVQYGAAFVFLLLVMGIAFASIFLRIKMRNQYHW